MKRAKAVGSLIARETASKVVYGLGLNKRRNRCWLVGSLVVTKTSGEIAVETICSSGLDLQHFRRCRDTIYMCIAAFESVHRLSGAQIIGVTSLTIKDDAEFIKKYLIKSDGSNLHPKTWIGSVHSNQRLKTYRKRWPLFRKTPTSARNYAVTVGRH